MQPLVDIAPRGSGIRTGSELVRGSREVDTMPAASVGTEGFGQGLVHHQKLTKSRNRTVVKPILKKFHSASPPTSTCRNGCM